MKEEQFVISIALSSHREDTMLDWCKQHFGSYGDRFRYRYDSWNGSSDHRAIEWIFKNAEDAALFTLKFA